MKWKIIFRWIFLSIIVIALSVSFWFSTVERKKARCEELRIVMDDDKQYVTAGQIERTIYSKVPRLKGCLLDTLGTERIEMAIRKNPWIKNAEVFKGYGPTETSFYGGILKVHIKQYDPVFRVQEGDGGFFVDAERKSLPYTSNSDKKLLVVTGNVKRDNISEGLYSFVEFVNHDKFWSSQIEQVHVRRNGELVLVPRVGNHLIEFGEPDQIEKKFRNLKALYKEGFADGGWNKYRYVSLKYTNQIVCTLR